MEMEVDIPEYESDLPFKTRVNLREWYVKSKINEMKVMYFRQISKMENDYEFYLIIK